MPLNCKPGEKEKYRFTKQGIRLGLCGSRVVETTKYKKNKSGVLKKVSRGKILGKE